jgi:hypothetical protein
MKPFQVPQTDAAAQLVILARRIQQLEAKRQPLDDEITRLQTELDVLNAAPVVADTFDWALALDYRRSVSSAYQDALMERLSQRGFAINYTNEETGQYQLDLMLYEKNPEYTLAAQLFIQQLLTSGVYKPTQVEGLGLCYKFGVFDHELSSRAIRTLYVTSVDATWAILREHVVRDQDIADDTLDDVLVIVQQKYYYGKRFGCGVA